MKRRTAPLLLSLASIAFLGGLLLSRAIKVLGPDVRAFLLDCPPWLLYSGVIMWSLVVIAIASCFATPRS